MDNDLLWLWLTQIYGIGLKKVKILLDYYGTIEDIQSCNEKDLIALGFKDNVRRVLLEGPNEAELKAKVYAYKDKGISFITIDSYQYPQMLKNIFDPPSILYVRGHLHDEDFDMSVGVVGARRCSEYGKKAGFTISKELAEEGITIVSGMARGIDAEAHKGAIAGGGRTIAVLGSGVDVCYPKEHQRLMSEILNQGAVISEFSPGVQPRPGHFPLRNRIISGLSCGLVVIEAAKKSGSLITADQGLEQGKDIYALPGSIYSKLSEGTNHLISQGARILTSSNDILKDFGINNDKKVSDYQTKLKIKLEKEEKMIYDSLGLEPLHSAAICNKVGLSIDKIQSLLTIMEVNGYIKGIQGKGFIKK